MLNEKKQEYFKKLLTKRLQELQAEVDLPTSSLVGLRDESPEFVDQATLESDLDFNLHIKERESKLIGKIQDALDRLAEGTYGVCEACGEEISEKRLQARPVTTLCIQCKKKQEAQEKLRGL